MRRRVEPLRSPRLHLSHLVLPLLLQEEPISALLLRHRRNQSPRRAFPYLKYRRVLLLQSQAERHVISVFIHVVDVHVHGVVVFVHFVTVGFGFFEESSGAGVCVRGGHVYGGGGARGA